jgi:hypothetical protein
MISSQRLVQWECVNIKNIPINQVMSTKYLDYHIDITCFNKSIEYKTQLVDIYKAIFLQCQTLSDFELYGLIMAWINDLYEFKFDIGPNFAVAVGLYSRFVHHTTNIKEVDMLKEAAVRDYIVSSGRLTKIVDRLCSLQTNL